MHNKNLNSTALKSPIVLVESKAPKITPLPVYQVMDPSAIVSLISEEQRTFKAKSHLLLLLFYIKHDSWIYNKILYSPQNSTLTGNASRWVWGI